MRLFQFFAAVLVSIATVLLTTLELPASFALCVFVLFMILIGRYDQAYELIPNVYLLALFLSALGLSFLEAHLFKDVLWLLASFLVLMIVSLGAEFVFKKTVIGMGDIKLLSIMGMVLHEDILLLLLGACVLFIVSALIQRKNSLAFGPYIVISWFILHLGI
ncbi:MAG: hypothetical protein Q4E22_06875 [Coriobacteriia bacterium]|nr:hypothetical protein [Coriobacteriia bacterium]